MRKAFTLAELLVVVAILTIIVAFGIPNYTRAVSGADERAGVANLRAVAQALELYKSNNGSYPNFAMNTIRDINDNLNLGIVEQNLDYSCDVAPGGGGDYRCTATRPNPNGWQIRYQTGDADVNCSQGNCPYCGAQSCPP